MVTKRNAGAMLGSFLVLAAAAASANQLDVRVTDRHGAAVTDVVVSVVPQAGQAAPALHGQAPVSRTIDQVALQFVPYLQVLRPGDKIIFRNSDKTRHHVYSFSPVKAFQFMLVPGQSSPALELDKPGVIAVGCNIHDRMIAYLFVSDAPWVVRAGADGRAVVRDLPAGSYSVRVWQPRLRGKGTVTQDLVFQGSSDTRALEFKVALSPDSRRQTDREHAGY